MTLIELLVALMLLGLLTSIVIGGFSGRREEPADVYRTLQRARNEALRSATPVRVRLQVGTDVHVAVVEPDGSMLADSILHIDRISGRKRK